jgi:hypothetical protein
MSSEAPDGDKGFGRSSSGGSVANNSAWRDKADSRRHGFHVFRYEALFVTRKRWTMSSAAGCGRVSLSAAVDRARDDGMPGARPLRTHAMIAADDQPVLGAVMPT